MAEDFPEAASRTFLKEFGNDLISVVVYGSSVKDSFQPGESDVDLLYIVKDDSKNVWQREAGLFKAFKSTWEYRACDHWFKTRGFYGYPEVTAASLRRGYAKFQPIYLDMIFHRAVLYDRDEFFQKLMEKLRKALSILGTIRVEHPVVRIVDFLIENKLFDFSKKQIME